MRSARECAHIFSLYTVYSRDTNPFWFSRTEVKTHCSIPPRIVARVKSSVLVVDRGVCTFASKALRADAAGAAAAVIVQTHDVWPYVMEDSMGEVKAAGGLKIPVCMVSREKGTTVVTLLHLESEQTGSS